MTFVEVCTVYVMHNIALFALGYWLGWRRCTTLTIKAIRGIIQ